ncbi:tetracycline resistance protein, class H-like [Littorina saxatilis]|uniref:tetracycline resistance protein, class H-like n=1 Tax=Littorina saxatilis TaxID=31220 RepID=UPI0038B45B53
MARVVNPCLSIHFLITSTRNGRKALLVLPCVTHVLSVLTYQLAPYWPDHLQVVVVVGGLFRGLTGKQAMFTTAVYGLLSDLLPAHERSTRFSYLLASRYAGVCLGTMAAGMLQDTVGIIYTMDISSIPQIVCLVLVIFFIKDTAVVSSSKAEDKQCIEDEKQTNKKLGELQRNKAYWVVYQYIRRILYAGNKDEKKSLVACEEKKTEISGADSVNNSPEELTIEICEEGQKQQTNMGMLVLIFSMALVTQSVWSSQREVIVQSVSVPPLNWPVSWYGYLFSVYFGAAGIGLIVLAPLIRRMSPPSSDSDVNTIVCAIMFGTLGCLWMGLAIVAESDWQVFTANILSALALMSNATLRSMASKNARADLQGTVMALMSVKENLSKVLGPICHSAIFVASLSFCPTLVYYVMAVEAFLMLGIVAFIRWRQCKENRYEVL